MFLLGQNPELLQQSISIQPSVNKWAFVRSFWLRVDWNNLNCGLTSEICYVWAPQHRSWRRRVPFHWWRRAATLTWGTSQENNDTGQCCSPVAELLKVQLMIHISDAQSCFFLGCFCPWLLGSAERERRCQSLQGWDAGRLQAALLRRRPDVTWLSSAVNVPIKVLVRAIVCFWRASFHCSSRK